MSGFIPLPPLGMHSDNFTFPIFIFPRRATFPARYCLSQVMFQVFHRSELQNHTISLDSQGIYSKGYANLD